MSQGNLGVAKIEEKPEKRRRKFPFLTESVKVGSETELTIGRVAGRKFPARVIGTSSAINPTAKRLLTELEVPNQTGELFPGAYVQVTLKTAGLITNLGQIQGSKTTDAQYQRALARFRRHPDPPGQVLNWVCRDNVDYLDLTQDRLEMNPA